MPSFFYLLFTLAIFASPLFSQNNHRDIKSVTDFSKDDDATGYCIKKGTNYIINQQIGRKIHRLLCDSNFNIITSYSFRSEQVSFNRKHINTPVFVKDLQIENSLYEIYSDKNTIVVTSIDFTQKRDSIRFSLQLSLFEKEEKRLAVMPFARGVRVLSYLSKQNKLRIYKWEEGAENDTVELLLPKVSLSEEEIMKYSKDAKIKYKESFDNLIVSPSDAEIIIGNAGTNGVYYSDKKFWILSQTPFYTGYNIIEADLETNRLKSSNIMLNDMRKNNTASYDNIMRPYGAVINNHLLIRNTSNHYFEYHLYDIETKRKLKEYIAESDESLKMFIHSDFNQKGTWFSANDEKKVEKEKAFLRKLNSGMGFISMSENGEDSIIITTGSLITTSGFSGLLLSIGTGILGYMANITIGNFQIIPYLEMYRNKLVFCHSKFSKSGFESSASESIKTYLDGLIDNFEKRDLKSSSSFILVRDGVLHIAVFNQSSKSFSLHKIIND